MVRKSVVLPGLEDCATSNSDETHDTDPMSTTAVIVREHDVHSVVDRQTIILIVDVRLCDSQGVRRRDVESVGVVTYIYNRRFKVSYKPCRLASHNLDEALTATRITGFVVDCDSGDRQSPFVPDRESLLRSVEDNKILSHKITENHQNVSVKASPSVW